MTGSDRPMPLRLVDLGFDAPMPPRQRQALLQEHYPDYEIWYVPRALGGMTWCARRDPQDTNPIRAELPSELAEAIEVEIAGEEGIDPRD
jgi:hypothetical protein